MEVIRFKEEIFKANNFLVIENGNAVLIDASVQIEVIREALRLFIAQERPILKDEIQKLNQDVELGLNDSIILDGDCSMKNLITKYE